ncbi:MAG TPA: lactate dehydrogenase, partial [Spirochaetes bacterium]|nr:lactate dehydrogenase [Spirochaetota bacterium]
MKILFAAPENAWGGFLHQIRERLPHCVFEATGSFEIVCLKGYDALIPTMSRVDRKLLESADRLALIQQCGAGLEAVDLRAAHELNIPAANVPTDSSGNAASVAEIGVYLMTGLSRNVRAMERS